MERKETYSLLTITSMIVGIVIGSGIYFKADDILLYTNGNIYLGILVLALGSVAIIFGALSLSVLARNNADSGGIIAYFNRFMNPHIAHGMGWFITFIYLPTCDVVVSWAGAIYTYMLLGIEASLSMQIGLGLVYNLFFIFLNSRSRKLGGYVQNLTTIIKLIPLFLIAIYGIFFANPVSITGVENSFMETFTGFSWIQALIPLMFAYDGWTVSLSISAEVKDPKKNVKRALIIAPFIILIAYLTYLLGLSKIIGPENIISLGDRTIFEAGRIIFGERLANVFLVVIILSVLGVVNGVSLALVRMPQALAEKGMIPDKGISKIDEKTGISKKSTLIVYGLCIIWSLINFLVIKYQIFNGRDVAEISVVFNYLSYLLLYRMAYGILKKEGKNNSLIIPIIASLGSLIILIGSLIASFYNVSIFLLICFFVVYLGFSYSRKKEK